VVCGCFLLVQRPVSTQVIIMPVEEPVLSHAGFNAALNRARELAGKIGSGEKRPLENGDAKRPNNDELDIGAPGPSGDGMLLGGDQVTVDQLQIPESMVGLVIGRGGEQVDTIQGESRCRVQVEKESSGGPTRTAVLTGTRQSIEKAKELICAIVQRGSEHDSGRPGGPGATGVPFGPSSAQVTEELLLPGFKVGLVIGKGGENLKRIQNELAVRLNVIQETTTPGAHDKPLRITGAPDKVELAKQRVIELMNSRDDGDLFRGSSGGGSGSSMLMIPGAFPPNHPGGGLPRQSNVLVPQLAVGTIIGRGGETIRQVEIDSGARVQFKPGEEHCGDNEQRTAIVTGTEDQIQKATQLITDLVQQAVEKTGGGSANGIGTGPPGTVEIFYLHVPAKKAGLVIGRGGESVKQIEAESKARVELCRDPPANEAEKVIIIKGTPEAIHHAKHLIRIKVGDILPGTALPPFDPVASGAIGDRAGGGPGCVTGSVAGQSSVGGPSNSGGGGAWPGSFMSSSQTSLYNYGTPADQASQGASSANGTSGTPGAGQEATAAWAAYYAQYYAAMYAAAQQPQQAGGQQQPQQPASAAPVPNSTPGGPQAQQPVQMSAQCQPIIDPISGQPDYSAQWAQYYRLMGMHDQATLMEQRAAAAAAAVQQRSGGNGSGSGLPVHTPQQQQSQGSQMMAPNSLGGQHPQMQTSPQQLPQSQPSSYAPGVPAGGLSNMMASQQQQQQPSYGSGQVQQTQFDGGAGLGGSNGPTGGGPQQQYQQAY
jgi:far upstream element-binding protein